MSAHYIPSTVLCPPCALSYLIFQQLHEVSTITVHVLQLGEPTLSKVPESGPKHILLGAKVHVLSPNHGGSQVFLNLFLKLRTSSAIINHLLVIKVTFNPQPNFLLYFLSLRNVTFSEKCDYTKPEFHPT